MKTSVYEELKVRKPFEFNDIFLYLFVLALCLSLFLFFMPFNSTKALGFKVIYDRQTVFTFYYETKTYTIDNAFEYSIEVNTENSTVTVYFSDDKSEYNVIEYDAAAKSVRVTKSSCSDSKECTKMPALTSNSGAIYCTPHKLKIVSVSNNTSDIPVTGA